MTVSDLTVQVLNIDGIVEGLSTAFSSRETSIRLAGLRNKTGRIFTGITDQGTQAVHPHSQSLCQSGALVPLHSRDLREVTET
jgi:hypothetical protein